MIKVGFIDYYLDEWHANNYPEMLKKHSNGRYEVVCAYGAIDSPLGGMTNAEWSEKYGIPLRSSIEEVIAESDVLIVLSPDNPEQHPTLCDLPLRSGKRVYIDKTFATDASTAKKLFAIAEENNTPCFSSSALRFSAELKDIDRSSIFRIYSEGPGVYEIYSIHQIEPIVSLMSVRAKRVMFTGDREHSSIIIEFADGRFANMYHRIDPAYSFRLSSVDMQNRASICEIRSDYFGLFIDAMIEFFDTGSIPVEHSQTIDVIAIREAGLKGMEKPFEWIELD